MARRKGMNLPEGDDGKTIVNMNVDGMPWYYQRQERPISGEGSYKMTREEQRAYIKAHYSWEEVVDETLDLYRGSGI